MNGLAFDEPNFPLEVQRAEQNEWVTKDLRTIRISEMSTDHIRAVINHIKEGKGTYGQNNKLIILEAELQAQSKLEDKK